MDLMRRQVWIGALLITLSAGGRGLGREPPCGASVQECFLERFHPVGGWHPYGGGLLHWWPSPCFPCGGAPDDYGRKPLPRVCWPSYPAYCQWGPPEIGCQPSNGSRALP